MATKNTTIAAEIQINTKYSGKTLKELKSELKDLKDNLDNAEFGSEEFKRLNKEIDELQGHLNGTTKAAAGSVKELKELRNQLKNTAAGSEEFKKLTQQIDDTQEAINAAKVGAGNFADVVGDLPGPIGEVGQKVSGLTSGIKQFSQIKFTDIKGSFKELFNDIKDIGANIAKLTGLTKVYEVANNAASKSLQFFGVSAQSAATASKAFGIAISGLLAATGLILLTASIQAVSEAWEFYATKAERADESQKKLNETLLKGAQTALDAESRSIKRTGDLLVAQAKARRASADEIYNIEQKNRKLLLESQERYYNELKNKDSEEARTAINAIKDTKNEILLAELNFQDQKNKLIDQKNKEATEKSNQEKIEEEKKFLDNLNKEYESYLKRKDLANKTANALTKKEIKENKDKDDEDKKNARQKEIEDDLEWQTKSIANVRQTGVQILAIDQANSDAKKRITKEERDMRVNAAYDIADASIALGAIIGEQTKAGKALGVASALINTYLGASEVIRAKSVLPEPFGTIQKIASVASIIATGIKSVKSIMSVQVPATSGGGGGGGAMPSIPSMNVSAPLMAQASTTTLNQAQVNQIGNVAARAFVVESDVSGNQERIQRLNRAARIN